MHSVTDALLAALGHYFSFADEETEAPGDDGVQLGSEASFPHRQSMFSLLPLPKSPEPCHVPGAAHSSLQCVLTTVFPRERLLREREPPPGFPLLTVVEPMTHAQVSPMLLFPFYCAIS